MKVHVETVHLGKCEFPCHEAGCERSFSRKHDLKRHHLRRHHQSAHTDLGSPRNMNNAKKGKNAKVRKAVREDEDDK